ncbi:MAG: MBL fold metallo-hydrolase [Syntrophobacterales bacterium]|nr:MAG: MBL fold metallo-hydrolase [Syntrophobacterales bacterium]
MEITILGSGTCVPSLKRGSPGLILRIDGRVLLFDSGTGTLERMLKRGITYLDLDLVLYTHTHPDHIADLVPLIFACKYGENPRREDFPIIGGRGFKTYFRAIQEVYGHWLQPGLFRINITEVYEEILDYDLFRVIAKPMVHISESVGYRVESNDGKSIAISGDTDYCPQLVELARDVDVLVIESALPDEMKAEGHLTPSLAGRIGREAHCKKMVLTHLYPVCDTVDIAQQCRKEYRGELLIAEDLMEISL